VSWEQLLPAQGWNVNAEPADGAIAGHTRWSLTTLREKLVKIGARLIRHARPLILHRAEVAIPRDLFGQILSRIRLLTPVPT